GPLRPGDIAAGQPDAGHVAVPRRVQLEDPGARVDGSRPWHAHLPGSWARNTVSAEHRSRVGCTTRQPAEEDRCESGAVPPLSPVSKPHLWSRPGPGWKTGVRVDPGARTLRLSRPSTGARTPEEAAWTTARIRAQRTRAQRTRARGTRAQAHAARWARWRCSPRQTPTCS